MRMCTFPVVLEGLEFFYFTDGDPDFENYSKTSSLSFQSENKKLVHWSNWSTADPSDPTKIPSLSKISNHDFIQVSNPSEISTFNIFLPNLVHTN